MQRRGAPERLRTAVSDTATADSRPELEELFRAPDGTFELFVVNLNVADAGDEAKAVVELLREHLTATAPAGLETHVTGAAAISSDYLEAVQVGTDSTTTVTIFLVILVLLAIYRAPLAALIPLVTIGVAYVVSKGVLGFLAAAGWQVSSTLETFLVVMVFGVGTDYAIFLISRYREEVSHDGDWHDAAKVTVKRIGAVITASRRHGDRRHDGDGRRRLQDDHVDGPGHRHRGGRDARGGADAVAGPPVDLRALPVLAAPHPGEARGRAARLLRRASPGPSRGGP